MDYAGFWKRSTAALIDSIVLLPLGLLDAWVSGHSRRSAMAIFPLVLIVTFAYEIVFHAAGGQTIGKQVMKVRVVRPDGGPIGWSEAWRRASVGIGLTLLSYVGQLMALSRFSDAAYRAGFTHGYVSEQYLEFVQRLSAANPLPAWTVLAAYAWVNSEYFTMLFSARKRSWQDLVGGTVVVNVAPPAVGARAAAAPKAPVGTGTMPRK